MKVTFIPIVIDVFDTDAKGLVKGLEDLEITGRVETIQTTALLRSARIPRRVLETKGDLLLLKLQWKTVSYRWWKKNWEEKQLYELFKRLTSDVSHEKTWTWLRKGNFKRETESLPIAAQNNVIRTSHIKVRTNKIQQNSRCSLYSERDETINNIISEYSKSAQKEYKTRHDWVVKVIHWELCKKLEFDHTNEWYMHNPASLVVNETYKLIWDFEILRYKLIT